MCVCVCVCLCLGGRTDDAWPGQSSKCIIVWIRSGLEVTPSPRWLSMACIEQQVLSAFPCTGALQLGVACTDTKSARGTVGNSIAAELLLANPSLLLVNPSLLLSILSMLSAAVLGIATEHTPLADIRGARAREAATGKHAQLTHNHNGHTYATDTHAQRTQLHNRHTCSKSTLHPSLPFPYPYPNPYPRA